MQGASPRLGERMHSAGIVLKGHLAELRWLELLHAVARAIGMEAVGNAKVWTYPFEGKGGTGQTIILPITESFLCVDTWSDHSGAYLFVCSCRPYALTAIHRAVEQFGLVHEAGQGGGFYAELKLK